MLMVMNQLPPFVIVPSEQFTTPLDLRASPCVLLTETNVTLPVGSGSETMTFCAAAGPLFVTCSVYTSLCPDPRARRSRFHNRDVGLRETQDNRAGCGGIIRGAMSVVAVSVDIHRIGNLCAATVPVGTSDDKKTGRRASRKRTDFARIRPNRQLAGVVQAHPAAYRATTNVVPVESSR